MKRAQHAAVDAFRHTICAARDVARTSSIAETLDHVLAAVRAPRPGRPMHDACEVPEICELPPSPARQRSPRRRQFPSPSSPTACCRPARVASLAVCNSEGAEAKTAVMLTWHARTRQALQVTACARGHRWTTRRTCWTASWVAGTASTRPTASSPTRNTGGATCSRCTGRAHRRQASAHGRTDGFLDLIDAHCPFIDGARLAHVASKASQPWKAAGVLRWWCPPAYTHCHCAACISGVLSAS